MNPVLKILLYVVLAVGAVVSGQRFFAEYSKRMEKASHRFEQSEGTNVVADTVATNAPAAVEGDTASVAAATNAVAAGAGAAASAKRPAASPTPPVTPAKAASGSMMGAYGAVCFVCVLVLGLMCAHDASQYVASRAHREMYNENAEGVADPEYDQAEQVWADGNHLEAIRLMREYLAKNPREVHVSLRIAEIYEKDLSNPLASALEYEEILQKKLDPERWGWAAVHLCNLYYRLNTPDKADALLQRIVKEYGATAAAKKARARLGLPEAPAEGTEESAAESEVAQAEPASENLAGGGEQGSDPGQFKLPPGFRKKKG